MRTRILEDPCPKCGQPMYLLPYSGRTNEGVMICDAICENCLHVRQVTTIVANRWPSNKPHGYTTS